MTYSFLLKAKNNSWRPAYVRNMSSFTNKIANYRAKWLKATPSERIQIERNFNRNYSTWLKKVKMENVARRRENQALFNKIRQMRKTGNSTALVAMLNTPPPARSPRRPSSTRPRNSTSLLKTMFTARLNQVKKNLRERKNALEKQRNAIEAEINRITQEIRSLPVNRR